MSARKALGKGLGALIPGAESGEGARKTARPTMVGIEEISPSRFQPRIAFDEQALDELAESIRSQGVIEPLVVRYAPEGSETTYELVAGERRWRAAQKIGADSVPVILRDMSDREALELGLTENIQRENLNPVEEARAYRMLIDQFGIKQDEVATRVGVNRSTVANALRLLRLESDIQDDVVWGKLSAGHARALLQLEGETRNKLRKKIIAQGLSVRQAETAARKLMTEAEKKAAKGKDEQKERRDAAIKDLEERLSRSLGTRVVIKKGKRGGSIEIKFAGESQFEGICNRLLE